MESPRSIQAATPFMSLLTCALLALSAFVAVYALQPPSPAPATAPESDFSALRAFRHTLATAQVPHPGGSPANDAVREYLVKELKAMGVETEVQVARRVDGATAIETKNVLARIRGTANTKAFAIAAHYDSVPYGPGATDDGVGVVAMLETARAVKAGPPLKNDIIFVFTDTEEGGLQGAKGFLLHPWAEEIGVMLNLEARGTCGPSMMFETSSGNGRLIAELAKAGVSARASSMMFDVYRRMPFNSDFTVFKNIGMPGLNVACVDNFAYYHTMNDSPENMNLATLQNHGSYTLGLARHFGKLDLNQPMSTQDAIYFNTIGSHLVHYPMTWGMGVAVLAAAMCGIAVVLGLLRGRLSLLGLLGGIGAFGAAMLCVSLFTLIPLAIAYGPAKLYTQYTTSITHLPDLKALYHNSLYGWALAAFAVCTFALCHLGFRRLFRVENLAAGALIWWLPLLAVLQKMLPGGSYYAAWPLFFSSLGLALWFLRSKEKPLLPWQALALGLFALPGIFLLTPAYEALLSTVMIFLAPALVLLFAMLLGLVIPQLELMASGRKWWLPAMSAATGLVLLAAGLFSSGYSPERRKLNSLAYAMDADKGEAFWLSPDEELDEWTAQFFPSMGPSNPRGTLEAIDPGDSSEYWRASAPVAGYAGPQLQVMRDATSGDTREVVLRITAPDKPSEMYIWLNSGEEILSTEVFGNEIRARRRDSSLKFRNFPREGADITLRLRAGSGLSMRMTENLHGLPELSGIPKRPEYMQPEPNTIRRDKELRSDNILVSRAFELPN